MPIGFDGTDYLWQGGHDGNQVPEFVVGKNVARNSHGFQFGEIAVFDKPEGEHEFQKHPEYRKLVPKIVPNMEMGITMDFVPIEN